MFEFRGFEQPRFTTIEHQFFNLQYSFLHSVVLAHDLFIPFLRFQKDGIDVLDVLFKEFDCLCE